MEDLNEAGGVYAVMNELTKKDLLYLDLPTVTGKTVGENIGGTVNRNPEVIRPIENPYSQTGGIAVSAIGPPTAASGDTWPIEAPLEAPEKRPSVINATDEPSPMPAFERFPITKSKRRRKGTIKCS